MTIDLLKITSLIPRPPPFFVIRFAFRIIHRSWKVGKKKQGRPGNILSRDDVWWKRGGHRAGRDPRSNNILDFIIEHSSNSQDPRRSWDWQYSTPPARNSLYGLLHMSLYMGTIHPTSTSHPPDVIHMIGVPIPSPFFATLLIPVYYTECKLKRGYEITTIHFQLIGLLC